MALRFLQQASDNGYPAASVLIGKVMLQKHLMHLVYVQWHVWYLPADFYRRE